MPAKSFYSTYEDDEQLVDYEPEEPGVFSAAEDDVMRSDDDMPVHEDGTAAHIQPITNFPAFLAEDSNVRSRRRRSQNVFQEEGAAGASDSGAQEPRTPEGILTTDVGNYIDTLEEPEAAERKRRRTAVPGQSSGAVEVGRNASKAAPKRKGDIVHPLAEAGGVVDSAASIGRSPEGRKSHTSSSNVAAHWVWFFPSCNFCTLPPRFFPSLTSHIFEFTFSLSSHVP
jgi:hypothetical protein